MARGTADLSVLNVRGNLPLVELEPRRIQRPVEFPEGRRCTALAEYTALRSSGNRQRRNLCATFPGLGRPLVIKRASDLLDCYVGNTEKQIAAAFEEPRNPNPFSSSMKRTASFGQGKTSKSVGGDAGE